MERLFRYHYNGGNNQFCSSERIAAIVGVFGGGHRMKEAYKCRFI